MKKWSKDIIRSAVAGFLLPAGLLIGVVAASTQPDTTEPSRAGVKVTLPILLTTSPETLPPLFLPVLHEEKNQNMELEEYLVGVLLSEVPTTFDMEALKAQAVAARTYALKSHQQGYKHQGAVCTTASCCQGYLDPEDYLKKSSDWEGLTRVRKAVRDTAGLVLTYDDQLILATYFDSSGGSTEDAAVVWGKVYPYLLAVPSPGEAFAPHDSDETSFTADEFQIALGQELEGEPETWFGQATQTPGGGVETMVIGDVSYSGTRLRSLLGLRSTVFSVTVSETRITFSTRGYGHRVGLSQYGAEAMARAGSTYQQILEHYYSGVKLEKYKFEP